MDRAPGPPEDRTTVSGVAISVLRYLMTHPEAGDTADGILGCWLPARDRKVDRKAVERALDELERAGLVTVLRAADSRAHYRLNATRAEDVRALLKREEDWR
jgi:DNA-binding MarR family transcriptional regulator